MNADELNDFSLRYAAAWSSQSAVSVAAFYEENGSLQINDGPPSKGRVAITAAAQSFMTAFPDMVVSRGDAGMRGSGAIFRWTLVGTNTGPGGTGKLLRISGYEEWRFGKTGLIGESKGHFDEADYERQLSSK